MIESFAGGGGTSEDSKEAILRPILSLHGGGSRPAVRYAMHLPSPQPDIDRRSTTGLKRAAVLMLALFAICLWLTPAQAQHDVISPFVDRNQQTRIFYHWEVLPDCTIIKGWNVAITTLPEHGTAELKRTTETITHIWLKYHRHSSATLNLINKCMGKEILVISIFYRSKPEYSGFDRMAWVKTNLKGQKRTVEARIAVR